MYAAKIIKKKCTFILVSVKTLDGSCLQRCSELDEATGPIFRAGKN